RAGGGGSPAVDPPENARERPSEPRLAIDRERAPEPIEEARQAVRTRPRARRRRRGQCPRVGWQIEAAGSAVAELRGQRLPPGRKLVGSADDPRDGGGVGRTTDVSPCVGQGGQGPDGR